MLTRRTQHFFSRQLHKVLLRTSTRSPVVGRRANDKSTIGEFDISGHLEYEKTADLKLPSDAEKFKWNWVPPRSLNSRSDDEVIPVMKGKFLTSAEIVDAIDNLAGEDVRILPLNPPIDTIKEFIICTGRSTRHLKKMSDVFVKALKNRELRQAPGYTGAEGEKDDDWLIVDCYNCAIHFMLPDTRRAIDLESHWAEGAEKPTLKYSLKEQETDAHFDELLEKYPIPAYYDPANSSNTKISTIQSDTTVVPSKKNSKR